MKLINIYIPLLMSLLVLIGCSTNKTSVSDEIEKEIDSIITVEQLPLPVDSMIFFPVQLDSIANNLTRFYVDTLIVTNKDSLYLEIPAQFNTGKLWSVDQLDSGLELIKEGEDMAKEKQKQTFLFKADDYGTYKTRLIYKRPFGVDSTGYIFVLDQFFIVNNQKTK